MNCEMEARATVNPTEDLEKVTRALSNVFDYEDLIIGVDQVTVTGEISCLHMLKESLEARKIRETARRILMKGTKENRIYFKLSKQAAFAGKVNLLTDELSALGEIDVVVKCENTEKFTDWICGY